MIHLKPRYCFHQRRTRQGQTDYRARYNLTANKCVTPAIKRALIDAEFIPQDMFPDV